MSSTPGKGLQPKRICLGGVAMLSNFLLLVIVPPRQSQAVLVDLLLEANGKVCASGNGVFVAVKEGHPAYHRWN